MSLLNLILGLFRTWLGVKQDTAIAEGKYEEKSDILRATMKNLQAQAQQAAQMPLTDADVDALADKGKF